jgi:hypothetical protein
LSQKARDVSRTEPRAQPGQAVTDPAQGVGVADLAQSELELLGLARLGQQPLLGAFQGQPVVVEERLDAHDHVDVAPAIDALAGRVLLGAEQLELGFPVPEHVGGHTGHRLHLADPVVELFRRLRRHE